MKRNILQHAEIGVKKSGTRDDPFASAVKPPDSVRDEERRVEALSDHLAATSAGAKNGLAEIGSREIRAIGTHSRQRVTLAAAEVRG